MSELVDPFADPEQARAALGAPPPVKFGSPVQGGLVDPLDDADKAREVLGQPKTEEPVLLPMADIKDLPELGSTLGVVLADSSTPNEARGRLTELRGAVNMPRTVPGKINAILEQMPGSTLEFGEDGTPVINIGGDRFVVNREGMSAQDFRDIAPDLMIGGPMTGGAASAGRILGKAGAVLGATLGGGASVVARDELGRGLGSKEETSLGLVAFVGGLSGVGEAAAPFIAKFIGKVFGNKSLVSATGELTDQGRKVLRNAGIPEDEITPAFIQKFKSLSDENPAAAARMAETQSLAEDLGTRPVPLTRGDVTRDTKQQAFESAVERGAPIEGVTPEAAEGLKSTRNLQQEVLGETADALRARTGTGGPAGEAAQRALLAEQQAAKKGVSDAYTAAGESGAALSGEGFSQLSRTVARDFRVNYGPSAAPKVNGIVNELSAFSKAAPGKIIKVNIQSLERWRQRLTAVSRGSDAVESGAAKAAIKQYDAFMDDAVEKALISGDLEAIKTFRDAGRLRRIYYKKFEADELVKRIVQTVDDDLSKAAGDVTLKLTPTESMNLLFTASNGLGARQGSARAVVRIKSILGADSEAFKALKEEALLRMFSAASKGTALGDDLGRTFSGDKFASAFEKSMQGSPELMRALFTQSEIKTMAQLRRVALLATNRVPGAVNYSNTATITRLLGNFGWLGAQAGDVVSVALRGIRKAKMSRLVQSAIDNPLPPRPSSIPAGVGGGVTAGPAASGGNALGGEPR